MGVQTLLVIFLVWDVSNVIDMSMGCLILASNFNQDISNWDVSNVTNISGMFWNAQVLM